MKPQIQNQPDPNQIISDIIQATDDLRGVYIRETQALESADSKAFMTIQDEKVKAAAQYQNRVETALKRKEDLGRADLALKERLKQIQENFAELGQKNMEALERMRRTTERLGNTILHTAKENIRRKNTVNYSEAGRITQPTRKPISIGLSETA